MSRRIGDMMVRISQESATTDAVNAMTEGGDFVEELIEAEVETNLVSESVVEAAEDLEAIANATESLESNLRHINSLVDKGIGLEPSMVLQWQNSIVTSMEACGIPSEVYETDLAVVQLSFENNSAEDYSPEAIGSIGKTLKKLWDMFLAALARAKEWLVRLWNRYTDSGKKLMKAGEQLSTKGQAFRGKSATGEMSASGFKILANSQGQINAAAALRRSTELSAELVVASKGLFNIILQTKASTSFTRNTNTLNVIEPMIIQENGGRTVIVTTPDDGKIINTKSVTIEEKYETAKLVIPTKVPALTGDQVVELGTAVTNAGRGLLKISEESRKLNFLKMNSEQPGDYTPEEIIANNATLSIAIRLMSFNDNHLMLTARKAYQYGVASLKALAKGSVDEALQVM